MLAAGPFGLGLPELLVILVVLVLVFGVNKIGDMGGALGKSVREFRRNAKDGDEALGANSSSNNSSASAELPSPRFCANCGAEATGDAKFCANCGTPVQATVR